MMANKKCGTATTTGWNLWLLLSFHYINPLVNKWHYEITNWQKNNIKFWEQWFLCKSQTTKTCLNWVENSYTSSNVESVCASMIKFTGIPIMIFTIQLLGIWSRFHTHAHTCIHACIGTATFAFLLYKRAQPKLYIYFHCYKTFLLLAIRSWCRSKT